ncbi:uncharacterized protein METZ01_LOCUS442765, partial [marine metagenome]
DCLPWTELTAVGGDNEITLAWFPLGNDRGRDFSLSLDNVDTNAGTLDINMTNSEPVAGFQFNLEGINITSGSGGSAGDNGFMISSNSTTILGFSLTGASIPAGSGTLVSVTFNGFQESICLSDPVLSDPSGQAYAVELGDCYGGIVLQCEDPYACNFMEDGDCEYAEENYNCDGNCTAGEDCFGECGGSAELDACGVCDGPGETEECGCEGIPSGACDCDGNVDLGCGCGEAGPSGCDNACGSTAELDECGVCDGDGPS